MSILNCAVNGFVEMEFCRQCKGKAIPFHAWRGLEGSKRLRLLDLKKIGT
jgi:hypothetical protein